MDSLVKKTVFPNGLKVVTERIPYVRSVSLGVWINAGSRTDTIEEMGMAHFIEHMLFKGTEKRTVFDIADSLESLGGSLNAFTSRDMTCYYAAVLDEHLVQAVDVLSDILCNSLFVPDEIEREKLVVLEEIRSSQDIPEELVQDIFGDCVLNPDAAAKPIMGTFETVENYQRPGILEYMKLHYTTHNIVIAAAGNFEHDKLIELVSSCFRFNESNACVAKQEVTPNNDSKIILQKDILQSHLCIGGRTFGYADERRTALWLINTILGSGMSSRLFQSIREKHGLSYTIYSYVELLQSLGFITTYAATEKKNLDRTLELILEEYNRMSEQAIDEDTIKRVKSQLKGSLVLSLESTANRMSRLAKQEILLDTYYNINDTMAQIDAVTTAQIKEAAVEIFDICNLKTVVVTY
ncbi:MAG: pitrilysin family protein [Candidatus Latescibacter sp.]|nr:pitrilysin family protein [Candidatus Latescibacter sp.]